MSKNITLFGVEYTGVSSVSLPQTGGGTAVFTDCASTLIQKTITANGVYDPEDDNADGYSEVTVNVPSGGASGIGTLLGTFSVGSISTTDTTAVDTGVSITVKGVYDYDLLICECSVDTMTNGLHAATTRLIWLTASSTVESKNSAGLITSGWNCKISSSGKASTRYTSTFYGIYPNSCTISAGDSGDNGQVVMPIYRRYNSTHTGTINGNYTMRVYGVKIYDLIGG